MKPQVLSIIAAALLLAGCTTMGQSIDGGRLVAPDGTLRWARGSVIQTEGSQIVRSTDEKCDPKLDGSGNVIPDQWINCNPLAHPAATTAIGDQSPGAKAGAIAGKVAEGVIPAAAGAISVIKSADAIADGMVKAAKERRPDTTTVTVTQDNKQEGGGAKAEATGGTGQGGGGGQGGTGGTGQGGAGGAGGSGGAGGKGCSGTGCTNN